jgi:hypothetical protein
LIRTGRNLKEINSEKYKTDLSHSDKVLVTKLYKLLNKLLTKSKQEVDALLSLLPNTSKETIALISKIWANLNFNRYLNNYSLIKFNIDPEKSRLDGEKPYIQNKSSNQYNESLIDLFGDFARIEWKVEVTMSSIWMKKVDFFNSLLS